MAPGFEEIETITVVDILRRAGGRVTLAATQQGVLEGSRGVKVLPDCLLDDAINEDFDMVFLPGGQPGTSNLQADAQVREILEKMHAKQKYIAAICAAPMVLKAVGILENKTFTSHPSVKDKLDGALFSDSRVVVDGNIITSQSPGTAMEFAFKLVEILFGRERVNTVNDGVLAKL